MERLVNHTYQGRYSPLTLRCASSVLENGRRKASAYANIPIIGRVFLGTTYPQSQRALQSSCPKNWLLLYVQCDIIFFSKTDRSVNHTRIVLKILNCTSMWMEPSKKCICSWRQIMNMYIHFVDQKFDKILV